MFCQSKLFHIFVNNHTYMTQTLAWSWWKVWVTLQVKGRLRGCFAFFPTNLLSFRLLSWDGKRHEKCPDHLLSYFQYSVLLSSAETLLSPLKKVNNLEMFLSTYVLFGKVVLSKSWEIADTYIHTWYNTLHWCNTAESLLRQFMCWAVLTVEILLE